MAKWAWKQLGTVVAVMVCAASTSQANVLWERYRGQSYVPTPLVEPNYNNALDPGGVGAVNALLALAAGGVSNAVDAGSSAQIYWSIGDQQLCDTSRNDSSDACEKRAMGQVMYTVLQFPQAGTYNLLVGHDDGTGLDTASHRGGPDYRSALFVTGPRLARWTAENATSPLTSYTAAQANACVLVRLSWNNFGTTNHYGLYWNGPGITGTELVPASALLDPSEVQAGCVLPIEALDDSATLTPGAPSVAIDVLDNDTAGNGGAIDPASLVVLTPPATGTATCDASGCTYTPPAGGLTAPVNFSYRVCLAAPNDALCDTATVTISTAVAAPVAVPVGGRELLLALSVLLGLAAVWQRRGG